MAYTRIVSESELEQFEHSRTFPTLLQQFISKQADMRLTVVGDQFFGVQITAPPAVVDWRAPGVELSYQVTGISESLKTKCRKLLRAFGLRFGAFDFAVSTEGELYFLEVNPAGEWAWLDRELGMNIRDAIIDELCTTKN